MYIKQLSIFIENKVGRLEKITSVLDQGEIDIRAISVFDSSEFGILRLIVDKPYKAADILKNAGHLCKMTEVIAIEPEDKVGSLNQIFNIIAKEGINIEYIYSFVIRDKSDLPLIILRTSDQDSAVTSLVKNGVNILSEKDMDTK